MNEEEYLKAKINELEFNIKNSKISNKQFKNQKIALRFYKNTLDRVTAYNNFKQNNYN